MTDTAPRAPEPTAKGRPRGGGLASSYAPVPGHFDELHRAGDGPAAAWQAVLDELIRGGDVPFTQTWERAERFLRQNGVTYNVYGDPRGLGRPWPVDPVPMILGTEEWAGVERAVRQRVRLLERVLADLHGERRLLREEGLPPALLFGNPGYLPALNGVEPPGGSRLHLYAAELARSEDGRWWVVRDRTQAPSGAGYALENRLVANRCFPEALSRFHVRRLASFFATFRDSLLAQAPRDELPVRIALLTPGPLNETFFEHAYLARYLGFTLVQGADLTVRRGRVYLKTLGGLRRIHVLVRRQDDTFCDPLELREDSLLGVPGLVEAIRAGNVLVANGLGSGLVDAPALLPFLPGLAELLLGETLEMPSVATWWCGQRAALAHVREHLDDLVLKPAFPSLPGEPIFPRQLGKRGRARLLERIEERPHEWVAQERIPLSTAPTWNEKQLTARHLTVRVFAAATPDGDHVVMPGGLTRVSGSPDSIVVSMQEGGGSKDTWVLSDTPIPPFSLLDRMRAPVELSRAGFALPSRVADDLFWLGRYVERAEFTARVVRRLVEGVLDEPGGGRAGAPLELLELLEACGHTIPERPSPRAGVRRWQLARELLPVLVDPEDGYSMRSDLDRLHQIAFRVRDRISVDAWRVIREIDEPLRTAAPETIALSDIPELLDGAVDGLAAFSGLVMDAMTREMGWRFLDTGRRIERSVAITHQLRYALAQAVPSEERRLEDILTISASIMTYRSRYASTLDPAAVLDLLLLDRTSPRSLVFQLNRVGEHLKAMRSNGPGHPGGELQQAMRLQEAVRRSEVRALAVTGVDGRRAALDELLDRLTLGLPGLSEQITRSYFSHAAVGRGVTP